MRAVSRSIALPLLRPGDLHLVTRSVVDSGAKLLEFRSVEDALIRDSDQQKRSRVSDFARAKISLNAHDRGRGKSYVASAVTRPRASWFARVAKRFSEISSYR